MLKLDLRKLNKIIEFSKKLPRFLALHAFLVSLTLMAIAVTLGAATFYKYNFLAQRQKPEIFEQPLLLEEKAIQEILQVRQERQSRLDQAESKEYPNLFRVD